MSDVLLIVWPAGFAADPAAVFLGERLFAFVSACLAALG
jgi:hypothetical protein